MSTGTNSLELLDNDEDVVGRFSIDNKEIVAQTISMRNPIFQVGMQGNLFRWIDPASLYGVLRSYAVRQMSLTVSDPVCVIIEFEDDNEPTDFYKIGFADYTVFMDEYCGEIGPTAKVDWAKEGF